MNRQHLREWFTVYFILIMVAIMLYSLPYAHAGVWQKCKDFLIGDDVWPYGDMDNEYLASAYKFYHDGGLKREIEWRMAHILLPKEEYEMLEKALHDDP